MKQILLFNTLSRFYPCSSSHMLIFVGACPPINIPKHAGHVGYGGLIVFEQARLEESRAWITCHPGFRTGRRRNPALCFLSRRTNRYTFDRPNECLPGKNIDR